MTLLLLAGDLWLLGPVAAAWHEVCIVRPHYVHVSLIDSFSAWAGLYIYIYIN